MRRSRVRFMAIVSALLVVSIVLASTPDVLAYMVYDDGQAVHETLVNFAMGLYQQHGLSNELPAYLATIRTGAEHEDLLDHVNDRQFVYLTQTHFWDGDKGPDDPVDNLIDPLDTTINAWQKVQVLWAMALGEYRSGDKDAAYEYLGHVAHLLADQSVPTHAHEDAHPSGDIYEGWMTVEAATLADWEWDALVNAGKVQIPDDITYGPYASDDPLGPLYYLFYTMNQIGDYFPSDTYGGDDGWNAAYGDWIGGVYADLGLPPLHTDDLEATDDNGAILQNIRSYSYFYAIRSTAALFDLFWQEASGNKALAVVIDRIDALDTHDEGLSEPDCLADLYVQVGIAGAWYRNEGNQIVNNDSIAPGWAFGRNVGITGTIGIVIQVWDEDEEGTPGGDDDPSTIDPVQGRRDLDLFVNLNTGDITEQESGVFLGKCGQTLSSAGHPDDNDRSYIEYRVLLPNIPPTAHAGDDQFVDEGDLVTLYGTYSDPNVGDSHTLLWHLESSTNGQVVPDMTTQVASFTPNDNGVYTFSFTVTDQYGASGTDDVVITVFNVPPEVSIDSLTDELGAEIGVDVPVALVGLEVELGVSFTDAGTADTHEALIDWGGFVFDQDGAFNFFSDSTGGVTGAISHTHVYTVPDIYTITVYVADDDGGLGGDHTEIEVVDAAGAIAAVIERLTPLAGDPNIQAALDKLQGNQNGDASNGAIDKLEQGNPNAALEKIKQALEYMEAAEAADPTLDLAYDKGLLSLAAKSVAVEAIADATAVADTPNELLKIQQATNLVAEGDALLAVPDYVGAVDKYQEAVREVQGML